MMSRREMMVAPASLAVLALPAAPLAEAWAQFLALEDRVNAGGMPQAEADKIMDRCAELHQAIVEAVPASPDDLAVQAVAIEKLYLENAMPADETEALFGKLLSGIEQFSGGKAFRFRLPEGGA